MSAASLQTVAGLPAEVPDDLLPAPGDLCDTKQDAAFLDQNGLRSNFTGAATRTCEYRAQKRGQCTPWFRAVPSDAVAIA